MTLSFAMFCGVTALIAAAARDYCNRIIPDTSVVLVALSGVVIRFSDSFGVLFASLGIALVLFAAMVFLFHLGSIGGGDVKLIPAVTLLSPPGAVPGLLLLIALSGGAMAVCWLLRDRLRRLMGQSPARSPEMAGNHDSLPYGVAICAGTLAHLALLP